MIVLDSSVVLKWVLPGEEGASRALALLAEIGDGLEIGAVPVLLFYEVANVLALTPRLDEEDAEEAWNSVADVGLRVYLLGAEQVSRAMHLARAARVSAYDASYVALAESLGCNFRTADDKLIARLSSFPLNCQVERL